MKQKGEGLLSIRTQDGLAINIRNNIWDAKIVHEMFVQKPYLKHVILPKNPVVIDIGGYIGDFALYAAHTLKARRVLVFEPTLENYTILKKNVADNGLGDKIEAFNMAVSNSPEILLNVETSEHGEIHVSSFWYEGAVQRRVPATTIPAILAANNLDCVDLLKVDCEGAEYDIFDITPDDCLNKFSNIVFECHKVDRWEPRLAETLARLTSLGFSVVRDRMIVSAWRGVSR
ncbi:FkbM family methyltransferase [Mesorhizobium sp. M1399]|uniref:FkbM family methyltransferase n=1 Tax=Mesorhizobium sp. M1399 TaxID=2957096 RepID=UPI00333D87D8